MRLVVDLQACQTDSRERGIGRYARGLIIAVSKSLDKDDELIIAIDMADTQRARDVRNELRLRDVQAKVVGYGYPVTCHSDASPAVRRLAGQLRSKFFTALHPDVVLVCSLFETRSVFSTELDWEVLGNFPVAVIGYDLIPLIFPFHYMLREDFDKDWYRERLKNILCFDSILAISEASRRDFSSILGVNAEDIAVIDAGIEDTLASLPQPVDGQARLIELGIDNPFVLMVGNGDWRKNVMGALRAYAALSESLRNRYDLVLTLVGEDVRDALAGEYSGLRDRVHVLGWVDDATLALLYSECRAFFFPSYYEGFGLPVLEAMAFNASVLSSNAGGLPEVVHDERALFDPNKPGEGAALLGRVLEDDEFREELRRGVHEHAMTFTWMRTANKTIDALRALVAQREDRSSDTRAERKWPLQDDIKLMADACVEAGERGDLALENGLRAIARGGKRRVLVDISEVVRFDARTGIQRVTRRFLEGLATVALETDAFEVEPVCWTDRGVCYARKYARDHLALLCTGPDAPVRVEPSDLMFMLDSSWDRPERFDKFHAQVQAAGGEVVWMVYDLVPIRFPETCDPSMPPAFRAWLSHAIQTTDGFICDSDATRHDLVAFMDEVIDARAYRPWARTVHLGCDLDSSAETQPSAKGEKLRARIGARPYFTALGTLEPRKDHQTIIEAFDQLWANGADAVLVLIGKQGWNVDALVERIQQHPELDRRLFWLQGATDGDVRHLLKDATALIQASVSEGFGLPLIEAAAMDVPLLVSDIAVFHEIAGDEATYFPVGDSDGLAVAVQDLAGAEARPGSASIKARNWYQASHELAREIGMT